MGNVRCRARCSIGGARISPAENQSNHHLVNQSQNIKLIIIYLYNIHVKAFELSRYSHRAALFCE